MFVMSLLLVLVELINNWFFSEWYYWKHDVDLFLVLIVMEIAILMKMAKTIPDTWQHAFVSWNELIFFIIFYWFFLTCECSMCGDKDWSTQVNWQQDQEEMGPGSLTWLCDPNGLQGHEYVETGSLTWLCDLGSLRMRTPLTPNALSTLLTMVYTRLPQQHPTLTF